MRRGDQKLGREKVRRAGLYLQEGAADTYSARQISGKLLMGLARQAVKVRADDSRRDCRDADATPRRSPTPCNNQTQPGATAGYRGGTGVYLTDEVFLYRVVGSVQDDVVELEDCYGLDVVTVSVQALRARWVAW